MKKMLSYLGVYKKEAILAPLCKLLEAALELIIPIIVSEIIDNGIPNSDKSYIIKMVIIMVVCGFVGLIFSVLGQFFSAKCAVGYATTLRSDLFKKLQSLSFTEIDNLGTSSMITRMTSDVNQVQTGINLSLRLLLRSPFVVFGAAIMGTVLSPSTSYVYWLAIPILSIVIFGIIFLTMPMHKKTQENLDTVLGATRENLSGARVIRAFAIEDEEIKQYNSKVVSLEKSQNKVSNISNLMNPLTYIIINIAIVLLIYLGALKVNVGDLTQGQVIALYNYMSQILVELIKFANLIITIAKSIACAKRISKIFSEKVKDEKTVNYENINTDDYIVYDNVTLTYNGASEPSLENINFNVQKGQIIGIIGATGSGKTSLVHLLPKFYEATTGNIYINGQNIKNINTQELRNKIGIVMQKAVLFEGTISENLKWGNKNASEQDLNEACFISQSTDIITKKEKGLDSEVEQNGRNFSGGQRQRLSIARALVRKPEILILDDSSSALDYATDAALRNEIKKLKYGVTVFIISQRTASIQHADKILVLDDGKIVGQGTHNELLNSCNVYQKIYSSQFKNGGKN